MTKLKLGPIEDDKPLKSRWSRLACVTVILRAYT